MSASGSWSSTTKIRPRAWLERADAVDAHRAGRIDSGGTEHLGRRQPRVHHHLHFEVLEVSLEALRERPGVGAHRDEDPGICNPLEVAFRDLESRLVALRVARVAHRRLPRRLLELRDDGGVRLFEEERIAEELRRRFVDERRDLPRQGRHVGRLGGLHQREKLLVNVPVPDAVGDHVNSGAQQILRVVEIEDVRGDAESALVCLVDHRAVDLGRHLRRAAEVVVDADLDDVGLQSPRRERPPPRLLRRRAGHDVAGQIDAGPIQGRRPTACRALRTPGACSPPRLHTVVTP